MLMLVLDDRFSVNGVERYLLEVSLAVEQNSSVKEFIVSVLAKEV